MKSFLHTFIITLLIVLGLGSSLMAQHQYEEDVVYLKNGSVIRGNIIEREIGSHIKIELVGGSVMVFQQEDIKVILREPKQGQEGITPTTISVKPRELTARQKGIYHLVSLSVQGLSDGFTFLIPFPTSINYRSGYHINQHINLGFGVGFEAFDNYGTIPLYLDFHGELGPVKKIQPHYYLQLGYAFGAWGETGRINGQVISREFPGGPLGMAGGGIKLNTRRKAELIFSLGYKGMDLYSQVTFDEFQWDDPTSSTIVVERVTQDFNSFYNSIMFQASFGF